MPFTHVRPAEWSTMTRKARTKWNKANWVPDQYVADKSLAREARKLERRRIDAKAAQRRGNGIFALASALLKGGEERDNPRKRHRKSRSEVDTISLILTKAKLSHIVACAQKRRRKPGRRTRRNHRKNR